MFPGGLLPAHDPRRQGHCTVSPPGELHAVGAPTGPAVVHLVGPLRPTTTSRHAHSDLSAGLSGLVTVRTVLVAGQLPSRPSALRV